MYEKQQEKWLTIRYDRQRKQDEWKERNDVNRERAVDDKDPFTLEDYILISSNFSTLRCQLQFPMNQSWNLSLFCKMKPWKWKHNGETEAPLVLNVVGLLFDETTRANVLSPSLILKLMQRKTRITHFLDVSPSFILGLLQIIACVTKYCYCSDWTEIRDALLANAYTSGVIEGLKNDPTSFLGFTFTGQILSYKGRVVIPEGPHLRQKILYECHNTPAAAHGGFLKTIKVHTNVLATPLKISDLRTSRLFGREVLIRS